MSDIELTVTVQDHDKVRARMQDGQEVEADLDMDSLRIDTIEVFEEWLHRGVITKRTELIVLGKHLYRALFVDKVGELLNSKFKEGVDSGQRLRVQLAFGEDASELAKMPWEYLFHPDKQWFFATRVDLVLSRYIPLNEPRAELLTDEAAMDTKLRLLIVISQPEDEEPVLGDPVVQAAEKLAERLPIEYEVLDVPTIENLGDRLRRGYTKDESASAERRPFHMVHFVGHGQFNEETKCGEIALLQRDEKTAEWCPDYSFAEYLYNAKPAPRIAVLQVCESGRVDFRSTFAGVAPNLIREGVQAVVAMQYKVTNETAIAFTRAFYKELGEGGHVDEAVQSGRLGITKTDPRAYESRVFGTPVLYMRSNSALIRRPGEERAAAAVGSTG